MESVKNLISKLLFLPFSIYGYSAFFVSKIEEDMKIVKWRIILKELEMKKVSASLNFFMYFSIFLFF